MVDSSLIRTLDRKLGKIICFIFSILALFKTKKKKPIKKVLIMELFEIGASMMAYPSIRLIQKKLPDAELFCLCTDTVKESWDILGAIPQKNILTISGKSTFRFLFSLLSQILKIRRLKIDLLLDFELFMRIPAVIAFLTGAKQKAGFYRYAYEGLYRGSFYQHKAAFNQNTHISKNFYALTLSALEGCDNPPNLKMPILLSDLEFPRYSSQAEVRNLMEKKIKAVYPDYSNQKLILVSPDVGPNLSVRNYPPELYAQALKLFLQDHPDYLVLLTGVKRDAPCCDRIVQLTANPRCVSFCGKTATIREYVELAGMAKLVVGNDNGPLHFASLTDIKIIGLYSTDSPFVYGPAGNCVALYQFYHCSPCISALNHKRSVCRDNQCLQTIEPFLVAQRMQEHVQDKLKPRTINNQIAYLY